MTQARLFPFIMIALPGLLYAQQPAQEANPAPVDTVELRQGERLSGRILRETPDYIELKMGLGTVVGFDKSRVVRILRASHRRDGASPAKPKPHPVQANDAWFVLRDGSGACVGRMHATVQITQDRQVRIAEEWQFQTNGEATEITMLEIADAQLRPISCFYHERRLQKSGSRLLHERLVQGKVAGAKLVVQRRSLQKRSRRVYTLQPGTTFPLILAQRLRRQGSPRILTAYESVFDPAADAFLRLQIDSQPRKKVEWRGKVQQVRELRIHRGSIINLVWLDPQGQPLRREVSGQHLVANLVSKEPAVEQLPAHAKVRSSLVTAKGNPHAIYLPNPVWRAAVERPGQLALEAPLYDAHIGLFAMDQLTGAEAIATASDTVERWLHLTTNRSLRIIGREQTKVRRQDARRIDFSYVTSEPGKAVRRRGQAYVFGRSDGGWMVLSCVAPRGSFAELEGDFRRVCESVELRRAGFAPVVREASPR